MQNTKSNPNLQNFASKSTINSFLNYFKVSKYLHEAGIGKLRGYSVREVLWPIFTLPFRKKNFYQGIVNDPDVGFEKSVAYAQLNNARYNWRKFLLGIVSEVIRIFMKPLTDTARDAVLIIDDTSYERNRSKKVELLARVFNHVTHLYFRGFRIMQMGWSDGNSFLPVDFALLSSEKKIQSLY